MTERLHKAFEQLGISIEDNPVLQKLLSLTQTQDQRIKQQFELFLMDLLLGLRRIQEADLQSFSYYIEKLNETKGRSNFWGERFEVFMHHKLLQANGELIDNLRRGKEGKEPDFVFDYDTVSLGIELTTSKFTALPKDENHIMNKITDTILEKNRKAYAGERCALIIDITNLVTIESLKGHSLKELFSDKFNGFSYLGRKIKFGIIILCNSVYKHRPDRTLYNSLNPYLGIMDDNGNIDPHLNSFIRTLFNNFKPDGDYELSYYHQNI